MKPPVEPKLYGLLAEFHEPQELLEASRRAHGMGYQKLEAYTPFPLEGLADALGHRRTALPLATLIGGLLGLGTAFTMQYVSCVWDYPLNIGGRPYNSWPAFVPIMFELTVLGAALTALFGMLAMNGLPQPYHPLFNVPEFRLASRDRFFLCIEARDPLFQPEATRQFLDTLHPHQIYEVEP